MRNGRVIRYGCIPVLAAALIVAFHPHGLQADEILTITKAGEHAILSNPGTPAVGAKDADVVVVEYFDYNCPYCKNLAPDLQALLAADRKTTLVFKDWPILGDASLYAARSALAAQWLGQYVVAHDALISGPRLAGNAQIDALLKRAGLDLDALNKARTAHSGEIDALLARNDAEAHALGLKGTPGILIGRQLLPGVASVDDMKKLVASARHEK